MPTARGLAGVFDEGPLVRNYTPDEIGSGGKVWCLVESPDGVLFAGADRLLIFDGANWSQALMENVSEIRSICLQGDRVWAGGANEVGYFEKNAAGVYVYKSVTSQLGENFFGTVLQIFSLQDRIVLITNRKVVQLSPGAHLAAEVSDFQNDSSLRAFVSNGVLYLNQRIGREGKVRVLRNGVFEDGPALFGSSKNSAPSLLGRVGNHWIAGVDSSIFAKSVETGEEHCIYSDQGDLVRAWLNSCTVCSDDHVYIGTRAGGYFAIDLSGRVQQVTRAQGLASDTCNAIVPSRAGGMWVGTDVGISFVQDRAHAGWISLPGETRAIFPDGENVYVSFAQSAYYLTPTEKIELPELLRATWARVGDSVYAASRDRLFAAKSGTADFKELENPDGLRIRSIVGFRGASGSLYGGVTTAGGVRGFARLDLRSGERTVYEVGDGFGFYLQDKAGRIWYREESGKIMMLDEGLQSSTQQFTSRKRSRLTLHNGTPLVLFDDTGFTSMRGEKILNTEDVSGALGTENVDGPAWVSGRAENSMRVGVISESVGGLVWKQKNIPGLRRLRNITSLFLADDQLWIGGDSGVIHVDTRTLSGPNFEIPEMKISVRDPKAKTQRLLPANTRVLQLSNQEQEISLRLKTRIWGLLEPPQYESRLLPVEDEWKLHNYGEDISRIYIPTGQHTLQIRVRHLGESGPVTAFQVIRPLPWYFSYTGITLFGLVGCLFFYGAVKLRTRQITARNRELEIKIAERTHELARANAAKSEFLAAMSHEIRNPMNGVIGIVKILQEAKLGSREKYYLATLHRCAEQLRTTVDDVLDFSKIEAGAITLHPDTFDLSEAINSTISALDLTGDRLELASWAGPRPTVTGDQGKFCQILTNYFSNALKYGVPPSASIDVFVLSEGPQRCRVTVAVKNSGPDIPPHEQATLFETFTRGEYAKRGRIGGSGLGLSICKKYAEAMGGSVAVTSSGGLTVFQVTLPFEIAQSRHRNETDSGPSRSLNARALAIEDEDYNRLVLGNILAKLGYKVDWACDGKTALQLASQNGYDLILTDLMLPDTDGGSLTKEILKHCEEPKPPIFAVTAYSTKEKEDECLQAGMAGFISKPVTVEKLEAALLGWASRHRTSAKPYVEPVSAAPASAITVAQLARLGPLEVILPDFIRKIETEWAGIDRMLEDRECTPAANAAHKLISAMLIVEADVMIDQLRLLENRLRDGALETEIEKVRGVCRDEAVGVVAALRQALERHHRLNADRSQK